MLSCYVRAVICVMFVNHEFQSMAVQAKIKII